MTSPKDDIIIIDSSLRAFVADTPSSFTYLITGSVKGYYRLKYVRIYNSAYNINATNNVIYWNENATNLNTTVPPGTYTPSQLATAIATAMTTTSAGYNTYAGAQNANTNTLTVSAANNFFFKFKTNTANSIGYASGFGTLDGTNATSQTGTYPMNCDTYRSYNILVKNNNQGIYSIRDNSGQKYTFNIPMTVTSGSVVCYDPQINFQYANFDQAASVLKVSVVDNQGNLIGLNNADWYMILERVAANDMIVQPT